MGSAEEMGTRFLGRQQKSAPPPRLAASGLVSDEATLLRSK